MLAKDETKFSTLIFSVLFIIVFIPSQTQALCVGPESCGILGGFFLSMLTVPICIIMLFFAIWPKTRKLLQIFAALPGFMVIITGYLIVLQGQRADLIFIPLIHLGIMILMIFLGRLGSSKESKVG